MKKGLLLFLLALSEVAFGYNPSTREQQVEQTALLVEIAANTAGGGGGMAIGGAVTDSTDGSVLFIDGGELAQDNPNLFWDNLNDRLGIGTASPGQDLTVDGTIGILEGGGTPSFHTIFQGGDQAGDVTYTLPINDGTANDFLQSNGSGVLTWAVPEDGDHVNSYYVSKDGNDTTGDGSLVRPWLTVSKAMTVIGNATDATDFNLATKRFYTVKILSGVYVENVAVPIRPRIIIDLEEATIGGNITVAFDQGIPFGGTISTPVLILKGSSLRPFSGGYATGGLAGDILIDSTSGSSLIYSLELQRVSINGNITKSVSTGGAYTLALFASQAMVSGTISSPAPTGGTTLYADNIDTSSTNTFGPISGNVNLNIIRNVRFNGIVTTTGCGGRWFNVTFAAVAHDFTGSSCTVSADSNSVQSFQTNVPTKGSVAFTRIDTAFGTGYTPTTSGDWSPVPTHVGGALDQLAANAVANLQEAYNGGSTINTTTGTGVAISRTTNTGVNGSLLDLDMSAITSGSSPFTIRGDSDTQVSGIDIQLGANASSAAAGIYLDYAGTGSLYSAGIVAQSGAGSADNAQFIIAGAATGHNITLSRGGSESLSIDAPTGHGTYVLQLPPDDGDVNEVLTTDGNGVTTWEPAGTVSLQGAYDGGQTINSSTIGAPIVVTNTNTTAAANLVELNSSGTDGYAVFSIDGVGAGFNMYGMDLEFGTNSANASPGIFLEYSGAAAAYNGALVVEVGDGTADVAQFINTSGSTGYNLGISRNGSDFIGISAPAGVTTYEIKLPPAQGGAGETLINDASGNLSWGAPSGGSLQDAYDNGETIETAGGTAVTISTPTGCTTGCGDGLDVTGYSTGGDPAILADSEGTGAAINTYAASNIAFTMINAAGGANNRIHLKTPTTITSGPLTMTLPGAAPASNGQVLSSTTAGIESWISVPKAMTNRSNAVTTSATCTVDCSAGEIATGGGCENNGSVALISSFASDADTWSCTYVAATNTCTAHANCFTY